MTKLNLSPNAAHSFDWNLLQTFLAVFDTGSMLAAAKKTGLQQPTVSRQIAELELQLGLPLFERTGRGVLPSNAALAMVVAVREMESQSDNLIRALNAESTKSRGTVRVSASQSAACFILPEILAKFTMLEPEISIEVEANNKISNLLKRDADIALRMVRPEQGALITKKLGNLQMHACAHIAYLEQFGTPNHPTELLSHRLIGNDLDTQIIDGFKAAGFAVNREHFALRTDDQNVYARLVHAAAGIGFMDLHTIRQFAGVRPILLELNIPPLPCWLTVHREIHGSQIVRKVYDFLSKEITAVLNQSDTKNP